MKYLITGGTGSLGETLVKKLLKDEWVEEIRVFSRDEFKQSEMARIINDSKIVYWLGDVRNLNRLNEAARGVDVIIHTAAMKRMDQVSHNLYEVADINIRGARNVCLAGKKCKRIILVSTDKAFQPTCVYGASKMIAEKIFLAEPNAVVWRFGNFAWSRGSVWRIFTEQNRYNVPLTITDPDATRFVIDIDKVCDYVLSSVKPGLHYPKDMRVMKISDIAKSVAAGTNWEIVGLREGEKKHESLDENYSSDKCYENQ